MISLFEVLLWVTHAENLWHTNSFQYKKIIVKNVYSKPSTTNFLFSEQLFGYQENKNLSKKAYTENLGIYMTQQNMIFIYKTYK